MARVNVDDKVNSDERFFKLGRLLRAPRGLERQLGIGAMIDVWRRAQEEEPRGGQFFLTEEQIDYSGRYPGLARRAAEVGLIILDQNSREFRISGGSARLSWLSEAKANGKKGGNPNDFRGPRQPPGSPDPYPPGSPETSPVGTPLALALSSGSGSNSKDIYSAPSGASDLPKVAVPKKTNPEAEALRDHLLDAIRSHSPETVGRLRPNTWVDDLDKLIRIDKVSPDLAKQVIDWAHKNDHKGFWRPNLLSGASLRRSFPTLEVQFKASQNRANRVIRDTSNGLAPDTPDDWHPGMATVNQDKKDTGAL